MTQYQEILKNLKEGKCNYGNDVSGITYSANVETGVYFKLDADLNYKFFATLEQMARNINRFIKTGE